MLGVVGLGFLTARRPQWPTLGPLTQKDSNAVLLTPQSDSPRISLRGPLSSQDRSNRLGRSDRLSRFSGPRRCDTVRLLRRAPALVPRPS